MTIQQGLLARNAEGDALTAQVGAAGQLRIYTGAQPADCATAPTGTLLSQHVTGSPFAPAASAGALAPTLPANVNAGAGGTAGYWRVYNNAGTVCVLQGSAGTTGTDMILNTAAIVSGGPVQVNSWSITIGGA